MRDLVIASRSKAAAGSDMTFYARVVAPDAQGVSVLEEGKAVSPADVSGVTCAVFDSFSDTPDASVATPSVTVADSVVTLINNDEWNEDTTGFNFRHTVAGSVFATPGHTYLVRYALTLTNGRVKVWYHEHSTPQLP